MNSALTILLIIALIGVSMAQPQENYRSRNYKLNKNYLKEINSKKKHITVYQKKSPSHGRNYLDRSVRVARQNQRANTTNENWPDNDTANIHQQNTTLRRSNRKNGKRLISYLTMMLTFSLILVNK